MEFNVFFDVILITVNFSKTIDIKVNLNQIERQTRFFENKLTFKSNLTFHEFLKSSLLNELQ